MFSKNNDSSGGAGFNHLNGDASNGASIRPKFEVIRPLVEVILPPMFPFQEAGPALHCNPPLDRRGRRSMGGYSSFAQSQW